jgi:uncharacterized protein with GYD domain
MALYVHLVKMTAEGASKVRDMASVYATVKNYGESIGCKWLHTVACFGEYDFVAIVEAPNEVAALKLAGCASSTGAVQLQTLPACRIEDFFQVMGELPK